MTTTQDHTKTTAYQEKVRHEAEAKIQQLEQDRAREEAQQVPMGAKWGLVAVAGLMIAGWWLTFYEMWHRWFPAWHSKVMTLSERLTEGDSYYTHGPLVPLTSLGIAWYVYKRVGVPIHRTPSSAAVGWAALAFFLFFHLVSVYARVTFVSGFAFVGVIGALVLIWGGWPLLWAYGLPVGFLSFMVPLPEVWIGDLNFQLKGIAGSWSVWLLIHVFGIPTVLDGSFVYLPGDKSLVVENVCGGLRSLISLVWFASLFAMVCRVKGLWRLFMLAMAVPVAVVCNVVRITSLNLVAHYFSVADAGPGSAFHDLSGLLVFAVALGILFGIERLVIFASVKLDRSWVDERLMGFLESVKAMADRHHHQRLGRVRASAAVLSVATALSLWWTLGSWESQNPVGLVKDAVAMSYTVGDETFQGQDQDLDEKTLIILENPDYLFRRFRSNKGTPMDLLIVFSANNRKGTHPPEVCIEGGGDRIIEKEVRSVDIPSVGPISMRQLLTQRADETTSFLYAYKSGDHYTHSFFGQQFWIFVNGITSRNASGALIRLSTPTQRGREEEARQLLVATAKRLVPQIDQHLP